LLVLVVDLDLGLFEEEDDDDLSVYGEGKEAEP
jgi:hypothetical protein